MPALPALFVSHGAPTVLLDDLPAPRFWKRLGAKLERPNTIVVISAHWEQQAAMLTGTDSPATVHDFFGFPEPLYEITYEPPGNPALAASIAERLHASGFKTGVDPTRGLDHGAWVPLKLMYPQADIPVVQLAVSPGEGARHHLWLGETLRPLREQGVLVMGSGSATHNLMEFRGQAADATPPRWVSDFNEWLAGAVESGDTEALAGYRQSHPHGARNHPTEEHFVPLLVAAGAGSGSGERIHQSYTHGVLSMDVYAFA